MAVIKLTTIIGAPKVLVFDISRDLDLHRLSSKYTCEVKLSGTKSKGYIDEGDIITSEATHHGYVQKTTVEITKVTYSTLIELELLDGFLKSMNYKIHFADKDNVTTMMDVVTYKVPYSIFGMLFDIVFLRWYMRKVILNRNSFLKSVAEKIHNKPTKSSFFPSY